MPPMDNQIPDVRDPREGVCKNENGILFVEKRIAQEQQRTSKAQPPESRWHHDSFQLLSRIPLNEKAAAEDSVSDHPDYFPYIPLDAEKLAAVPNQIG
jgi:hypothetical protein